MRNFRFLNMPALLWVIAAIIDVVIAVVLGGIVPNGILIFTAVLTPILLSFIYDRNSIEFKTNEFVSWCPKCKWNDVKPTALHFHDDHKKASPKCNLHVDDLQIYNGDLPFYLTNLPAWFQLTAWMKLQKMRNTASKKKSK